VNKKAASLTLFDFSLAAADPADVRVGTAAYRDPEVGARGRWDAAADRYSAAMTLYELLTGQRPASPDDASGRAPCRSRPSASTPACARRWPRSSPPRSRAP
jgi:serine/threonine protein kinase